jgi:hypothetical protein
VIHNPWNTAFRETFRLEILRMFESPSKG